MDELRFDYELSFTVPKSKFSEGGCPVERGLRSVKTIKDASVGPDMILIQKENGLCGFAKTTAEIKEYIQEWDVQRGGARRSFRIQLTHSPNLTRKVKAYEFYGALQRKGRGGSDSGDATGRSMEGEGERTTEHG